MYNQDSKLYFFLFLFFTWNAIITNVLTSGDDILLPRNQRQFKCSWVSNALTITKYVIISECSVESFCFYLVFIDLKWKSFIIIWRLTADWRTIWSEWFHFLFMHIGCRKTYWIICMMPWSNDRSNYVGECVRMITLTSLVLTNKFTLFQLLLLQVNVVTTKIALNKGFWESFQSTLIFIKRIVKKEYVIF